MALTDKFKDLRNKAGDAVLDRKDQIEQAVQKAGDAADKRTGGRYHEQIQKAGDKATSFVDGLEQTQKEGVEDAAGDDGAPPTSSTS
jgi:MT0933-like antitoxin protein